MTDTGIDALDQVRLNAADPTRAIQLEEATTAIARQVRDTLHGRNDPPDRSDYPALLQWADELEETANPAMLAAATIAAYTQPGQAQHLLVRALQILGDTPGELPLRHYPALLVWYAAGTVLVSRARLDTLRAGGAHGRLPHRRGHTPAAAGLHPAYVADGNETLRQWLAADGEPTTKKYTPMSERLQAALEETPGFRQLFDTTHHFETNFDRFEWAAGVIVTDLAHARDDPRAPRIPSPYVGAFGWRPRHRHHPEGRWYELSDWAGQPSVAGLLIAGDEGRREEVLKRHAERVARTARTWH